MAWGDDAKLGSGLPDRFLLTITRARMETPEGWSNDSVVLKGEQNVDGELSDGDLRLSVGSFEKGDKDGTFLVHQTQRPEIFDTGYERKKKINKNSGYGRFLDSALGVVPLEENQAPDRAKFEIWDLLMWEGLTVDVEMRERTFTYQKGHEKEGQSGTARDAFVVGFVEAGGSATTSSAATSNGSSTGELGELASYESYMSYVEAATNAGQSDIASKADWEAARA